MHRSPVKQNTLRQYTTERDTAVKSRSVLDGISAIDSKQARYFLAPAIYKGPRAPTFEEETQDAWNYPFIPARGVLIGILTVLFNVTFGISWIIAGTKIKKRTNDATAALSVTKVVAAGSIILAFYWIAAFIALGGSIIGIVVVAFMIYAIVAQNGIVKLSKGL